MPDEVIKYTGKTLGKLKSVIEKIIKEAQRIVAGWNKDINTFDKNFPIFLLLEKNFLAVLKNKMMFQMI